MGFETIPDDLGGVELKSATDSDPPWENETIVESATQPAIRCRRCGYVWTPNDGVPKRCAKCHAEILHEESDVDKTIPEMRLEQFGENLSEEERPETETETETETENPWVKA